MEEKPKKQTPKKKSSWWNELKKRFLVKDFLLVVDLEKLRGKVLK